MEVKHLIKDKENGCPFGQKCGACNLYRPLYRKNQSSEFIEEWDCQINNLSTLMNETKNRTLGVQRAVEDFRNIATEQVEDRLEQQTTERLIHG